MIVGREVPKSCCSSCALIKRARCADRSPRCRRRPPPPACLSISERASFVRTSSSSLSPRLPPPSLPVSARSGGSLDLTATLTTTAVAVAVVVAVVTTATTRMAVVATTLTAIVAAAAAAATTFSAHDRLTQHVTLRAAAVIVVSPILTFSSPLPPWPPLYRFSTYQARNNANDPRAPPTTKKNIADSTCAAAQKCFICCLSRAFANEAHARIRTFPHSFQTFFALHSPPSSHDVAKAMALGESLPY